MSAPRLARANRSRFFIGLGILILTVGFVAIFHSNSSQHQLDELRLMERRCEQQQEALSQQIIIFEKSIQSERLDHQQTKIEQQSRFKELKEFREKTLLESNHKFGALHQNYTLLKSQHDESNLKFGALQQNYKILKSRHDDLVEEFQRTQAKHSELLKTIEDEHRAVVGNMTLHLRQRNGEFEELKQKYDELLQGDSAGLHSQLTEYREHCSWRPVEPASGPYVPSQSLPSQNQPNPNNFNAQIPIIPKTLMASSVMAGVKVNQSSSTPSSAAANKKVHPSNGGAAELDNAPLPTAERLSSVASRSSSTTAKTFVRSVPEGVVAVPPNEMILEERLPTEAKTMANPIDNRYANVVDEAPVDGQQQEEEPKAAADGVAADSPAVSEVDNGAREVMDNNEFLVDGHKDHLQAVLDDVKLSGNNNNAAEVDANGFDGAQRQRNMDEQDEQNDVDNAILNGVGVGNNNAAGDLMANRLGHNNKLSKDPKLMREIDADDGKVAGYPDDMHMEENNEEEGDGDDDEYHQDNPAARKLEPAVRN